MFGDEGLAAAILDRLLHHGLTLMVLLSRSAGSTNALAAVAWPMQDSAMDVGTVLFEGGGLLLALAAGVLLRRYALRAEGEGVSSGERSSVENGLRFTAPPGWRTVLTGTRILLAGPSGERLELSSQVVSGECAAGDKEHLLGPTLEAALTALQQSSSAPALQVISPLRRRTDVPGPAECWTVLAKARREDRVLLQAALRFTRRVVLVTLEGRDPGTPAEGLRARFDAFLRTLSEASPVSSPPVAGRGLRAVPGALVYRDAEGRVGLNLLTPHMQQFMGRCVGALRNAGIPARGTGQFSLLVGEGGEELLLDEFYRPDDDPANVARVVEAVRAAGVTVRH